MKGPNLPILALIISPVSGCLPSSRGSATYFRASSNVISSGTTSFGIFPLFGFFFLRSSLSEALKWKPDSESETIDPVFPLLADFFIGEKSSEAEEQLLLDT